MPGASFDTRKRIRIGIRHAIKLDGGNMITRPKAQPIQSSIQGDRGDSKEVVTLYQQTPDVRTTPEHGMHPALRSHIRSRNTCLRLLPPAAVEQRSAGGSGWCPRRSGILA